MRGAAANHGLPDTLVASLNAIADWLYLAGNPDHVMIGSAALAILLQGKAATADDVGDIDLVLTSEGATNLINAAGQTFQPPGASDRFRSAAFARLSVNGGLPVEIMGGFEILAAEGWRPVWPVASQPGWITPSGNAIQVATPAALASLFRQFGRSKDLVRLQCLERYLPSP